MTLAISTTLYTSFEDAVERTRKALAEQGFGVLTEIDVKATLKAKLDTDIEDYLILGACNPPLAARSCRAGEVWVHCGSGYRASIAASILDTTDRTVVLIDDAFDKAVELGLAI